MVSGTNKKYCICIYIMFWQFRKFEKKKKFLETRFMWITQLLFLSMLNNRKNLRKKIPACVHLYYFIFPYTYFFILYCAMYFHDFRQSSQSFEIPVTDRIARYLRMIRHSVLTSLSIIRGFVSHSFPERMSVPDTIDRPMEIIRLKCARSYFQFQ